MTKMFDLAVELPSRAAGVMLQSSAAVAGHEDRRKITSKQRAGTKRMRSQEDKEYIQIISREGRMQKAKSRKKCKGCHKKVRLLPKKRTDSRILPISPGTLD